MTKLDNSILPYFKSGIGKTIISSSIALMMLSISGMSNATTAPSTQDEVTGQVMHFEYANRDQLAHNPMLNAVDITKNNLRGIPTPTVSVTNTTFIPTVLIPQTQSSASTELDVTLLDDFIEEISPNARHYPPNFSNPSQRYYAKEKLKELEAWIRPYAENANASYEVLLRAAKLNGMARNLDLGSEYAVRASTYVAKAIDRQPNSAEANFLYGMMLSEGGGFRESKKYLNKAIALGYKEAEQSLAQADLLNDSRSAALARLQRLQAENPNDETIARQIQIVQDGKYYIWDLPVSK